ncbi:MAG: hypothetical protein QM784_31180 [Polyangiaceae bacterium]
MTARVLVTNFRRIDPRHALQQDRSLAWLTTAHTFAQAMHSSRGPGPFESFATLHESMERLVKRFACGQDKIAVRRVELDDLTHTEWSEARVYRLDQHPRGMDAFRRTQVYMELAERAISAMYRTRESPPQDLLHVTCTGYAAPSPAQRFVSGRGWGSHTNVTHVYHMGCYASIPALRIGSSYLRGGVSLSGSSQTVDVVHTELCSLHVDPLVHTPEQLVIQSIFADGFIAYSLCPDLIDIGTRAFELLGLANVVISGSADCMQWLVSSFGMQMVLSRDVPDRIADNLKDFLKRLTESASLDTAQIRSARFAVHPGGPKILDFVRAASRARRRAATSQSPSPRDERQHVFCNTSPCLAEHVGGSLNPRWRVRREFGVRTRSHGLRRHYAQGGKVMLVWPHLLLAVQALVLLVDEFRFHFRRGLPAWERIGHPIDTLTVVACYALAWTLPPTDGAKSAYVALAILSCLTITKDEFVHANRCEPSEHWLHAVLFILHPVVLAGVGLLWLGGARSQLLIPLTLTGAFLLYQILYWNTPWLEQQRRK